MKTKMKGWDRPVAASEIPRLSVSVGAIRTLEDLRQHVAEERYQTWISGGEEERIVGDSTGFSRVRENRMRCFYWVATGRGRSKKVAFTVVFRPDSANVA